MTSSSSLRDWPLELLSDVFARLEDTDALAFRSTSRDITDKLFFDFKTRFFKTRRYDFARAELDRLYAVSNDDRFAPMVESLQVSLVRWDHDNLHAKLWTLCVNDHGDESTEHLIEPVNHPFARELDRRWHFLRERNDDTRSFEERLQYAVVTVAKRVEAFDKEMHERVQLLETGQSDEILVTALSKFPDLRSLNLYVANSHYCWDASGALEGTRCGNPGTLRDGWVALCQEFGRPQRLQLVEKHQLLSQLFNSLARAQPLQYLTTLEVCMTSSDFSQKPPAVPTYLSAQLISLNIAFVGSSNDLREHRGLSSRMEGTGLVPVLQTDGWFIHWLNGCCALKSVVVAFHSYKMAWDVTEFANAVKFPELEHFGLSGYGLDFRSDQIYNRLTMFLLGHRQSLKSLSLSDIELGQDGTRSHYHYCKDLLELLASLGSLNRISFYRWSEKPQWPGVEKIVRFDKEDLENQDNSWGKVWTYQGSVDDVQAKLLQLSMSPLYR